MQEIVIVTNDITFATYAAVGMGYKGGIMVRNIGCMGEGNLSEREKKERKDNDISDNKHGGVGVRKEKKKDGRESEWGDFTYKVLVLILMINQYFLSNNTHGNLCRFHFFLFISFTRIF